MNAEELLQAGIESAKAGDKAKASNLLAASLKLNPNSEKAWLWLGGCLTSLKEKEYCFNRVLAINPTNAQAKQQLERLNATVSPVNNSLPVPPPEKEPTYSQVEATSSSNPETSDQIRNNYSKIYATLAGFFLGLLIFGGMLAYFVLNGAFARRTMPFAAVLWTPTHTLTATPTPTRKIVNEPTQTPTVIPSPTATLTYTQRMQLADPFFTEGFKQYYAGNWAESILSWDKAIELVPEDEVPYYMRGLAYTGLLDNNRYFDEYISNLEQAISDFDSAIAINPRDGDYYLNRYYAYSAMANSQETRADFLEFEKIASQNLDKAFYYGNTTELSKRNIPFTLIALGECDKAIDEINKQFSEQTEPSGTLNEAMALAQFCKGSPNKALKSIDNAIKITENCPRNTLRAKILYAMGKYPEAEKEINITLNRCPYYGGGRYFLRGLIYIAMGDLEKAQQDLDFGYGETWSHGGLYPYALGKIALANNDTNSAISYFQEAEATYFDQDMILDMIRADLAKLNAQPIEVEPNPVNATSIPTPTITLTPRPSSTPKATATQGDYIKTPDPYLQYAYIVDLETGTGPFTLNRNGSLYFRFQAPEPIDIFNVQSMSIWLVPFDSTQQTPSYISLISPYEMDGGINNPLWGENKIDFPWRYVTPDGDVYIEIKNSSLDYEVQFENASVSYTAQTKDGNVAIYGSTP